MMLTIIFVCLFALLSLVERVQCQTQTSLPAASYQAVSSDSSGTHLTAVVYNGPIYYSNDSGVSWAVSDAPTPTATYEAVATSSTGQYVIINSQSATYVSSDYGQHFTNITNVGGLSNTVAVSSTGQYMVAVSSSLSPNNCLSYSNDYGASFTLNLGPSTTSDFCVGVSIDTSGTYVVVSVYNQGLWTSNGVTNTSSWKLTTATTLEISAIAFGGTSFYAGFVSTPAYVIQSTDYGATWDAKGSVSNSIVSISVDSTGAQVLLGTFYNLFFSQDSAATFRSIDTSSTVSHSSMNSDATLTIYTQSVNSQQLGVFLGNPRKNISPQSIVSLSLLMIFCLFLFNRNHDRRNFSSHYSSDNDF